MKTYEILVKQIIEKLEKWFIPWQQTWINWEPTNYVTKRPYKWFNKLILSTNNDFSDNRYLTMKQIKQLWGYIKPWSHWTKIYYFKYKEEINKEELKNTFPIIRYYTVFNIEQTSWIKISNQLELDTKTNLCKAQEIITWYKDKPIIKHWNKASYNISNDTITIPSLNKFESNENYFSVLYHEIIHSTWANHRLSRFWLSSIEYFWSENYSKEELVAEIWAYFLCIKAGIENKTWENSKNYIASWLNYIKWNKNDLISACSQAEKAVEYIIW